MQQSHVQGFISWQKESEKCGEMSVGSKTIEGGTLVAYSRNIRAGMREISGKHLRESTCM